MKKLALLTFATLLLALVYADESDIEISKISRMALYRVLFVFVVK